MLIFFESDSTSLLLKEYFVCLQNKKNMHKKKKVLKKDKRWEANHAIPTFLSLLGHTIIADPRFFPESSPC